MNEYYIQLFSPHGLIRFNDPEIGRDKDTGGQVKYVLGVVGKSFPTSAGTKS